MFQFQHLLLMPIVTLMASDTAAVMPQFHRAGICLCMHLCAGSQRRRIRVGSYFHATQSVHCRKAGMRQVHSLAGQRQQMSTFDQQRRANSLLSATDDALLVLLACRCELTIEFRQVTGPRNRHPVVAPEIAGLRLDATLLLRLGWRAEFRFKAPVRTESNKPRRLFPPRAAHDLLHSRG